MLVKHNLLLDSHLENPQYWQNEKNFKQDGAVITAIFNQPGSLGLILQTNEELKADVDYTLSVYAKGTKNFRIDYNYFISKEYGNKPIKYNSKDYLPNAWHRVVIPFKHNEPVKYNSILFGFNYNLDDYMELSFKYPKLEVGKETTLYTPNKQELAAENQAYYPSEGNYKEIQAMRG